MSIPRFAIPLAALAVLPASAQFTAVNSGLPEPPRPCAAWGDYDNDGDLDVLIAGEGRQGTVSSAIYRNAGGSFSNSGVSLLGLESADVAWGDFDNDGDLDLAMTGLTNGGAVTTRVYRNNLTTFTAIAGPFQNLFAGQIAWIDTDGDGDLDLFYTGVNSTSPTLGLPFTRLYRNDAGTFTAATHPFGNFGVGGFAWEDYDRDGDPDLLITGSEVPGTGCPLWRNDGGTFTKVPSGLPDTGIGFLEWGDYDSDGDSDLLFGGDSDDGWISRIYRNDAGSFVNINAPLVAVIWSSAKWGDYDNDGDLDAMVIGSDPVEGVPVSKLYRNDAGSFIDSGVELHEAWLGLTNWADYDGDGDLDLLIAGNSEGGDHLTLYRNDAVVHDTAPGPPLNPLATVAGTRATLAWDSATDAQTPAAGLTYNVRIGTTPGGSEVVTAHAAAGGFHRLADPGNAAHSRVFQVRGLVPGTTYHWSVQSIDGGLMASAFTADGSFVATADEPENVSFGVTAGTFHAAWRGTPGSVYRIEASSDLSGWTPVATPVAAAGTGLFEFSGPVSAHPAARFYRAARP